MTDGGHNTSEWTRRRDGLIAAEAAYRAGSPTMTDAEFDRALNEYKRITKDAPEWALPLGDDRTEGFARSKHSTPMLSLAKISPGGGVPQEEQLRKWCQDKASALGLDLETMEFVLEPKIDGVSVSLTYEGGLLTQAVTRGDGAEGDVVTEQIRALNAAPPLVAIQDRFEVRGEVCWPNVDFERNQLAREGKGLQPLANARNGVAGALKSTPEESAHLGIKFVAFHLVSGGHATTQDDAMSSLKALGIDTVGSIVVSVEDLVERIPRREDLLDRLPYQIDGLVIKVRERKHHAPLGATSHHPNYAVAWKFPPERKTTTIREITAQVGKSGKITPVATFDPIDLAGTVVSRATLHNYTEIARKGIGVGSQVSVEKAGDIIPQVVEVEARPVASGYMSPIHCPSCSSRLQPEGPELFCRNPKCPAQLVERLAHFASRGAMDIRGMGPKMVERLIEVCGVDSPYGLFGLTSRDLQQIQGMSQAHADKLVKAIDASKGRGLAKVLFGLSIPQVGKSMASTLASRFADAGELLQASREYQKSGTVPYVEGMGEPTAKVVFGTLNDPWMLDVLAGLLAFDVDLTSKATQRAIVEEIQGETFVISGNLKHGTRAQLSDKIKAAGGKVSGSVSSRTSYLIAGPGAGSKFQKAEHIGVPIITEDEARAMLGITP